MQTLQKVPSQERFILVRVNGDPFYLSEALQRSMFDTEGNAFLGLWISELLIRQYAIENNISNSTEEMQVAAEELRYQRGLESVEKLEQWLKSHHQTILSLQNYIDYRLLCSKVRASIPQKEIEAYFAEHKLEFEQADLYSIRLCGKGKAEELYARITEEGENFHLLAMKHSLDEESRPKAGYVGRVYRKDLSAEIEVGVFNAQPGEVIGPVKTEKGYNLFKVDTVYSAKLEEQIDNIRDLLFEKLLNRLHAEAKIAYPLFEKV